MKWNRLVQVSGFLFAMCALLLTGRIGRAQKSPVSTLTEPKTVVDFFTLLPSRYFGGVLNEAKPRERLRLLNGAHSVVDVKNGYLFAAGDGAQQSLTLCLFKRADKSYVIAVSDNDRVVFDPFLDFYEYRNGRLRNITKSVLPVAYRSHLDYTLPRYGMTIHVTDSKDRPVYNLVWKQDHFVVR